MKYIKPRYQIRWKFVLWGLFIAAVATLLSAAIAPRLSLLLFPEADQRTLLIRTRWVSYGITLVLFAVLAVIFLRIGQDNFVNRILLLSEAAKQIAAGNFNIQVTQIERFDEVYQLAQDFNLMAKQLQQYEYLRKDFISNVSHEIKTPLAIIKGYSDLLCDPEADSDAQAYREYAAIISRESTRLLNLTTNMMQISRLDNQKIPSASNTFRLDEQLRQVILLLEPQWTTAQIHIEPQLQECIYTGNEDLLQQVWVNLLDNAIKFSPQGAAINVQLEDMETQVAITIQDYGLGMQAETQSRIFEQFYQGETSHTKEGCGLGLPIVKRIVQLHHGSIEVTSMLHQGTTVRVCLPHTS